MRVGKRERWREKEGKGGEERGKVGRERSGEGRGQNTWLFRFWLF